MQGQGVKSVSGRLFSGRFPIGSDDESLRRSQDFHSAVRPAEQHVVVPLGISQELLKRGAIDIPGRENQTAVQGYTGLLKPQLLLRYDLAVHAFVRDRGSDEIAVGAKRPAVIGTFVNLRAPAIEGANSHAAMRTDIEQHVDRALSVPGDDH